jgi:parvulin-like peptidyl-prolyl isomerase
MRPALIALSFSLMAATPNGPNDSVATVNGVTLRRWEAERELATRITSTTFHARVSPEKMKGLREQSLDALVLKEIKRQWAAREKVAVDQERAEAAWRKNRDRFPTQRDYDAALKQAGITDAEFRKAFARDEAAAAAERATQAAVPAATGEEVRAFFDAHRSEYVRPEARHVVVALVYADPGEGESARKAAEENAAGIAARVRAGGSLATEIGKLKAELPGKYQDKTGDLGFVHLGSLMPEVERAVFEAAVPSVVGPLGTMYGYHVVQVLERKPAEPIAFEGVREAVAARVRREREARALERFEVDLQKSARVERTGWASEP